MGKSLPKKEISQLKYYTKKGCGEQVFSQFFFIKVREAGAGENTRCCVLRGKKEYCRFFVDSGEKSRYNHQKRDLRAAIANRAPV